VEVILNTALNDALNSIGVIQMNKQIINIFYAGIISLGYASMANANLISNGDFESGDLSGGSAGAFGPFLTFPAGSSGIDAWTIGAGGVNLWTDYKGTGNHAIDIIGNSLTEGGSLYQAFSTIAGQQYIVSFDLSGANNPTDSSFNSAIKNMDVTIFGSDLSSELIVQQYEDDTSGWNGDFRPISFAFVADGNLSAIEFLGTNSGWNGYYIDNVNVVVPLPAAAWLMGSGILALLGISCCKHGAATTQNKYRI